MVMIILGVLVTYISQDTWIRLEFEYVIQRIGIISNIRGLLENYIIHKLLDSGRRI